MFSAWFMLHNNQPQHVMEWFMHWKVKMIYPDEYPDKLHTTADKSYILMNRLNLPVREPLYDTLCLGLKEVVALAAVSLTGGAHA